MNLRPSGYERLSAPISTVQRLPMGGRSPSAQPTERPAGRESPSGACGGRVLVGVGGQPIAARGTSLGRLYNCRMSIITASGSAQSGLLLLGCCCFSSVLSFC